MNDRLDTLTESIFSHQERITTLEHYVIMLNVALLVTLGGLYFINRKKA